MIIFVSLVVFIISYIVIYTYNNLPKISNSYGYDYFLLNMYFLRTISEAYFNTCFTYYSIFTPLILLTTCIHVFPGFKSNSFFSM